MSPRAHKKRRTESGPEALASPKQETDAAPDSQIEGELASALNGTNNQPQEGVNGDHGSGEGTTDPEVAVISNIIDRSERVEEQCAKDQQQQQQQQSTEASGQPASKGLTYVKASLHLKIQSLPILDNLVCGI